MTARNEYENKDVALVDILDAVLDKGVAIKGDLIISIAGIDLVYLELKVLVSSIESLMHSTRDGLTSEQFDAEKEELSCVIN
ncbi:gas vesicle protein [Virgibacillus sp. L01]|uniref:gas vesicle protein n=1 Tax=Virgibacillus sp. L01 TaxID=3457429 RepID=UPI003FD06713